MFKQTFLGALTTMAVMLGSSVAMSGGTQTGQVTLRDFDENTGELWGDRNNNPPVSTFLHTTNTKHGPSPDYPHNPGDPHIRRCKHLAKLWNHLVEEEREGDDDSDEIQKEFKQLLKRMSREGCNSTITNTDGNPPPIVVIAPHP